MNVRLNIPMEIALEWLINSVAKLAAASERIKAARAQGRDHLTAMEWQDVLESNDQARSDAQAAVELLTDDTEDEDAPP